MQGNLLFQFIVLPNVSEDGICKMLFFAHMMTEGTTFRGMVCVVVVLLPFTE